MLGFFCAARCSKPAAGLLAVFVELQPPLRQTIPPAGPPNSGARLLVIDFSLLVGSDQAARLL